jgi:hypothetical protein
MYSARFGTFPGVCKIASTAIDLEVPKTFRTVSEYLQERERGELEVRGAAGGGRREHRGGRVPGAKQAR